MNFIIKSFYFLIIFNFIFLFRRACEFFSFLLWYILSMSQWFRVLEIHNDKNRSNALAAMYRVLILINKRKRLNGKMQREKKLLTHHRGRHRISLVVFEHQPLDKKKLYNVKQ